VCVAVLLLAALHAVVAVGKCKVSKVRAVCESRCEKDAIPVDRIAVPPPGTLLPPTGIYKGVDEGQAPPSAFLAPATPADGGLRHTTALLEVEATTALSKFMACDDVESFISPVALLSWTPVHTASFGCADGRTVETGLGTWGGDIAEFITAINVYEQMTSIRLSLADVTNILRSYLTATGRSRFTTCMTAQVVRQMVGSQLTSGSSNDDMEAAMRNPLEERQAAMWMKITDPNFIGNDHVKLMLERPDDYSVRKELVQHVIHSFFDILWNQYDPLSEKLRVQILSGDHSEAAIVSVTVPDFCVKQAGLVPLISPTSPSSSVVILNPDAVQVLRGELSLFFSRMTVPVVKEDEMMKRLSILNAGQAALTSQALFDRVPVYSARISQ